MYYLPYFLLLRLIIISLASVDHVFLGVGLV